MGIQVSAEVISLLISASQRVDPDLKGENNVRSHSSGQSKGRYGRIAGTHDQGGGDTDHQRCPGIPSLLRDLCSRRHGDGDQYL